MLIEILDSEVDYLIEAISTAHLPTKRCLGDLKNRLQKVKNKD